jgi:MYXO-CTERM domain-containing protein
MLSLRHAVELVLAAAIAAVPAARAFAGASCIDACSGPPGQTPCGSFGLGCQIGGGQCIICEVDDHCQPGGTCSEGQCINLPCSPDAGGVPPPPDGGACQCDVTASCEAGCDCDPDCNLPCACDVSFACDPECPCDPECAPDGGPGGDDSGPGGDDAMTVDATTPPPDATVISRDAANTGGGARPGSSERGGCDCGTAGSPAAAGFGLLALVMLGAMIFTRRRR